MIPFIRIMHKTLMRQRRINKKGGQAHPGRLLCLSKTAHAE